MENDHPLVALAKSADSRTSLITAIARLIQPKNVAEIGVYKGDMAEPLLRNCPSIETYYMVDPWRNLEDWNKPANQSNDRFEGIFQRTMSRTAFAEHKRVVLRGKTTEVISSIENQSLDMVYIDGDHTLKGVAIDLLRVLPKMNPDGWILGDDFVSSIWQHGLQFEPTMVFPFAIHFAEGIDRKIYILPHQQFAIALSEAPFQIIDHSNIDHTSAELLPHMRRMIDEAVERAGMKSRLIRAFPRLYRVYRSLRSRE